MLSIIEMDPALPEAQGLLEQSWAFMAEMSPPEERFHLDLEGLRADHVTFFVARDGDVSVGCAAFAKMDPQWGELKSMFVTDAARGTQTAAALLRAVEDGASAAGCSVVRLETGRHFDAAPKFYAKHGFAEIGPFGSYPDAQSSLFMQKNIAPKNLVDLPA